MTAYTEDYADGAGRASSRSTQHEPPRLVPIDPRDWQDQPLPRRTWCVPGLVPAGTVSSITGDGAAGKSTLMLQLGVARACGKPWLGIDIPAGRTLCLSAEDDSDELHRRTDAIARHYGVSLHDLGDLALIDLVGRDGVLGALDRSKGKIEPTELFWAVKSLIQKVTPDLLIIDSLADAFAGMENDRQQARQFISLLRRLCREHGLTCILIAHPSVAGMANGSGMSGNTAWNNSVRSRLYFETVKSKDGGDEPELRKLTTKKSNYGPMGGELTVRYDCGAFVIVSGRSQSDRAARDAKADTVFLKLLKIYCETRQNVSPKPSPSYAPVVFAPHPDADYVPREDFAAAMQRLLKACKIIVQTIGPPSRQTTRLILAEDAAL